MVALADAVRDGRIRETEVAIVISDQPSASGLEKAEAGRLQSRVVERHGGGREEHERRLIETLRDHDVGLVCLAGYMRLLSHCFIEAYPNRILNIHPSLLPAFPGLDAQRQALEHGVKWTGCTVHFVDDTLDGGPIVAQRVVPVRDDDTVETLSARILEQEHELYVETVDLIISGNYELVGRRVLRRPVGRKTEG